MRTFLMLCLVVLSVAAVSAGYADIIDAYDWDAIVKDEAKFKEIVDCVMGVAPCGDKQRIKDGAVTLFRTNCGECSAEQKEKYEKYVQMIKTIRPKIYNDFLAKMQPKSA